MPCEPDTRHSIASDRRYLVETTLCWPGEKERRKLIQHANARLYDMAPTGCCKVSDTDHILQANLVAGRLLGMPCGELVGQPIERFIASTDQDIYFRHCENLEQSGLPQSCELRLLKPDGSHLWAQIITTPIQGPSSYAKHQLVLTDVNERRMAQDRMRISELALKAITQGVVITTPELSVVSVNDAFLSITGYAECELLGADLSLLNGPLTDSITTTKLLKAVKEKREFSAELLHYRKDGKSFWNELIISPVVDDQGQLTHFVIINTDVSERKRFDQAMLQNNCALQHAVVIAQKSNIAKSELLSNMSHELRSPLNAILGFAQLLETGTPPLTPSQQVKTEKMQAAGWYLLKLINDILDLAVIESGKLALSMKPVSLAQVLLECQSMTEPQAERLGIRVDFTQVDNQLLILADPLRLQQVIVNLMSNAIKYNRSGGTVDVTASVGAGGVVRINVHDTGQGISQDGLSHLFEPFNRLGQESLSNEGTGIGLVVTRRLTELMGGHIGVQSTVGVGSVFWVELSEAYALPAGNVDATEPGARPFVQTIATYQTFEI